MPPDPWLPTVAMLTGSHAVPSVRWPDVRIRKIRLLGIGDRDYDADLSPAERELLDLIANRTHIPRANRGRARGSIERVHGTYQPMPSLDVMR